MGDQLYAKRTTPDQVQEAAKTASLRKSNPVGDPRRIPLWATLAYGNQVPRPLHLPMARSPHVETTKQGSGSPTAHSEEEHIQRTFQAASQQEETQQERAEPRPHEANITGLPDTLKAGVETLSGLSMEDVHVHYNSSQPAQVQALAYTQGTEIHVEPGQEKHLAHEAWHVVQQKQGRVKQTMQAMDVAINDDPGLEYEANIMGEKAAQAANIAVPWQRKEEEPRREARVIQRFNGKMTRKATLSKFQDTTKYDGQIYGIYQNKSGTADDTKDPIQYVGQTTQLNVGDRFIQHTREDTDMPWSIAKGADYSNEDDSQWPYYPRELWKVKSETLLEIAASEEFYYEANGGLEGKLRNKIQPLKKDTFDKYSKFYGVFSGKGFPPGWKPKK